MKQPDQTKTFIQAMDSSESGEHKKKQNFGSIS